MIKHAYLILAHTNPGQIRTLLHLLDDKRNDIFVHIDANSGFDENSFSGLCKESAVTFVKRISVSWGGVSIVRAEMALLEEATKSHHSYYHLLSGMDLPIKSNDFIYSFFEANAGKEFLDTWKMAEHTLKRVQYYTLFPEGNGFFLTYWLNQLGKLILKCIGIKMNRDVNFRLGSQWFSITHDFASFIITEKEWVERTFRHTCLCDEIFIPTLLERSPYKENLYIRDMSENHEINISNMRFIDWSRSKSMHHPWVFKTDDFELLKSAPHLWARKFDERVDSVIINRITNLLKP